MATAATFSHILGIGFLAEHDATLPSVDALLQHINQDFGPCEIARAEKQPNGWYKLWIKLDRSTATAFLAAHMDPGSLDKAIADIRQVGSGLPPITGYCRWELPGNY